MRYIDKSWVKPIALGSKVISSGGGGNTENFENILNDILSNEEKVKLIETQDLEDDKFYCANGMMGISNVIDSYNFTGNEIVDTIKRMEYLEESKVSGIYPYEGAGINLLYPIITAKLMDIPLINGDIMGRCFTAMQMTTLAASEIGISPLILKDTMGIMHIFSGRSTISIENKIRMVLSRMDNLGFFACAFKKGSELKNFILAGTVSLAKDIGEAFINKQNYEEIINDIKKTIDNSNYNSGISLFKGKITDIKEAQEKKDWIRITLIGIEEYKKSIFSILAKDQYLLSYHDKRVSCMSPDIIATIDLDTLVPLTIQDIKKGMNIGILGIETPDQLKTKKALELMGLTAFGYKLSYKNIRELNNR